MTWLGVDIGGANLKLADGLGWARCVPFPLWRQPDQLATKLAELLATAPHATRIAVTMTGELCDCFRTKADGVRHILAAVQQVARGRELRVYLTDGRLATLEQADELTHLAAASNWHALARFACRFLEGEAGLLIDVGSTTTDVIPLANGQPCNFGTTDTERLACGELVYTGVGRTPICAVTPRLSWRGTQCPVAAEFFASTADAYVVLGDLPEQPDATSTADGRPVTVDFARQRLARMICADPASFTFDDALQAAESVRQAQLTQLREAVDQVLNRQPIRPEYVVTSGAGEFLARLVLAQLSLACRTISLAHELGQSVSICAPAHAVAVLAREDDRK
jgi:probable H4MPT-linked C1 transfer pathway protein